MATSYQLTRREERVGEKGERMRMEEGKKEKRRNQTKRTISARFVQDQKWQPSFKREHAHPRITRTRFRKESYHGVHLVSHEYFEQLDNDFTVYLVLKCIRYSHTDTHTNTYVWLQERPKPAPFVRVRSFQSKRPNSVGWLIRQRPPALSLLVYKRRVVSYTHPVPLAASS